LKGWGAENKSNTNVRSAAAPSSNGMVHFNAVFTIVPAGGMQKRGAI